MTEKQENILKAALKLFAEEGYHATSTSKVSKQAGVSEGLIFRHYKNKEGLLNAVMEVGEERFKALYMTILSEQDFKRRIIRAIDLPFVVKEEEYEFWNLQFKLKWEIGYYSAEKMEPLLYSLTEAFEGLDYELPALEAELVLYALDGIGGALLKGAIVDKDAFRAFWLKKYEVQLGFSEPQVN